MKNLKYILLPFLVLFLLDGCGGDNSIKLTSNTNEVNDDNTTKIVVDENKTKVIIDDTIPSVNLPVISNIAPIEILEDTQKGTILGKIRLSKNGDNFINKFILSGTGSFYFLINNDGEIIFNANVPLLNINQNEFNLKVKAVNNDGESNEIPLLIRVKQTVQSDVPVTLDTVINDVAEKAPIGTYIGTLKINTRGSSPITSYTISGTYSYIFSADSNGDITLVKNLQSYSSVSTYNLTFIATNNIGNSISKNLTININKYNPQKPNMGPSLFDVSENLTPPFNIGKVIAKLSEETIIAYEISGEEAVDFNISKDGMLSSNISFDYEAKNRYRFYVKAITATQSSSPAYITINVKDIADVKPSIENLKLYAKESTAIGTILGKVNILQYGDSQINGYQIKNDTSNAFGINSSGEIYFTKELLFDSNNALNNIKKFNVIATNDAGSSLEANVTTYITEIFEPKNIARIDVRQKHYFYSHTRYAHDHLGEDIAIEGDLIFVGTQTDSKSVGYVNVFEKQDDGSVKKLYALHGSENNISFGHSIDVYHNKVAIGAKVKMENPDIKANNTKQGYIALYDWDNNTKTLTNQTILDINDTNDSLGESIAISSKFVAIGASDAYDTDPSKRTGKVYIYNYKDKNITNIINPISALDGDHFGASVALSEKYLVVGAPEHSKNDVGAQSGSVYIYDVANNFSLIKHFVATGDENATTGDDHFGYSVATYADRIIVGAPNKTVNGMSGAGAAYVFNVKNNSVNLVATLHSNNPQQDAYFGSDVDFNRDYFIIGSKLENSAYIYRVSPDSNTSEFISKLTTPYTQLSGTPNPDFGHAVAIDASNIVVSAPNYNSVTAESGSVFVYDAKAKETPYILNIANKHYQYWEDDIDRVFKEFLPSDLYSTGRYEINITDNNNKLILSDGNKLRVDPSLNNPYLDFENPTLSGVTSIYNLDANNGTGNISNVSLHPFSLTITNLDTQKSFDYELNVTIKDLDFFKYEPKKLSGGDTSDIARYKNFVYIAQDGGAISKGQIYVYDRSKEFSAQFVEDYHENSVDVGDLYGKTLMAKDAYLYVGVPNDDKGTANGSTETSTDDPGAIFMYKIHTDGKLGFVSEASGITAKKGAHFGTSLDVNGNGYIVVGSPDFNGSGKIDLLKHYKDTNTNIDRIDELVEFNSSKLNGNLGSAVAIYNNIAVASDPKNGTISIFEILNESLKKLGDFNSTDQNVSFLYQDGNESNKTTVRDTNQTYLTQDFGKTKIVMDSKYIYINAPTNANNTGAIYIYKYDNSDSFYPSDTNRTYRKYFDIKFVEKLSGFYEGDSFGYDISLEKNFLAVGSPNSDVFSLNDNNGLVYIYKIDKNNDTFNIYQTKPSSDMYVYSRQSGEGNNFGQCVNIYQSNSTQDGIDTKDRIRPHLEIGGKETNTGMFYTFSEDPTPN